MSSNQLEDINLTGVLAEQLEKYIFESATRPSFLFNMFDKLINKCLNTFIEKLAERAGQDSSDLKKEWISDLETLFNSKTGLGNANAHAKHDQSSMVTPQFNVKKNSTSTNENSADVAAVRNILTNFKIEGSNSSTSNSSNLSSNSQDIIQDKRDAEINIVNAKLPKPTKRVVAKGVPCSYEFTKGTNAGQKCGSASLGETTFCKKHSVSKIVKPTSVSAAVKADAAAALTANNDVKVALMSGTNVNGKIFKSDKAASAFEQSKPIIQKLDKMKELKTVKQNEFGNWVHMESGFLIDPNTKEIYGTQTNDEKVLPLFADEIDICKQLRFKYRMPTTLLYRDGTAHDKSTKFEDSKSFQNELNVIDDEEDAEMSDDDEKQAII